MKDFSVISTQIFKGNHIKENPSKNQRNPGMKDVSLISNEILKGIHIKENPFKNEKSSNDGFLKENPSKNEKKSRNEGFLFNF